MNARPPPKKVSYIRKEYRVLEKLPGPGNPMLAALGILLRLRVLSPALPGHAWGSPLGHSQELLIPLSEPGQNYQLGPELEHQAP